MDSLVQVGYVWSHGAVNAHDPTVTDNLVQCKTVRYLGVEGKGRGDTLMTKILYRSLTHGSIEFDITGTIYTVTLPSELGLAAAKVVADLAAYRQGYLRVGDFSDEYASSCGDSFTSRIVHQAVVEPRTTLLDSVSHREFSSLSPSTVRELLRECRSQSVEKVSGKVNLRLDSRGVRKALVQSAALYDHSLAGLGSVEELLSVTTVEGWSALAVTRVLAQLNE